MVGDAQQSARTLDACGGATSSVEWKLFMRDSMALFEKVAALESASCLEPDGTVLRLSAD